MNIVQFYKGDSVSFGLIIRGKTDSLPIDPTIVTIMVASLKISGVIDIVKVNNENMTKTSEGKYKYVWHSDAVGSYIVIYTAINNGNTTILKDVFVVNN